MADNKPSNGINQLSTSDTESHSDLDSHSNISTSSFDEDQSTRNMQNSNGHHKHVEKHEVIDENPNNNTCTISEYKESNEPGTKKTHSEETRHQSALVENLFQIPLLADSFHYVNQTKYGGLAVNAAGATLNTVSKITGPVQERFQPQIEQIDSLAANSVKTLGDAVPFLRTPTNDLLEKVTTPAYQTMDTVKHYGESVTSPVYSIAHTVSDVLEHHIALPAKHLAQNVDAKLEPVVTKFNTLVDSYLPGGDDSTEEESEQQEQPNFSQTHRAINTTWKAQRRLSRLVKSRINSTQSYTADQIKQTQVLQRGGEMINQLNAKVLEIYNATKDNASQLKDTVQTQEIGTTLHARLNSIAEIILVELEKGGDIPKAVQKRLTELAQILLETTDSIAKYVKENTTHFPETLRLTPMVEFFNDRYQTVMEEARKENTSPMDKARNIALVTKDQTLPILENALNEFQKSFTSYSSTVSSRFATTTNIIKEQLNNTARTLGVM
ncbi:hypothetical protein G9A89_019690 [Geosiphon pyriformis]|nr:hypothetical protein G9A89_019690 [Geosiphon pyriformis]